MNDNDWMMNLKELDDDQLLLVIHNLAFDNQLHALMDIHHGYYMMKNSDNKQAMLLLLNKFDFLERIE
jgi:hypothetical protein